MVFIKKGNKTRKISSIPHPVHTHYVLEILNPNPIPGNGMEQSVWVCRGKTRLLKITDSADKLDESIQSGMQHIEKLEQKIATPA